MTPDVGSLRAAFYNFLAATDDYAWNENDLKLLDAIRVATDALAEPVTPEPDVGSLRSALAELVACLSAEFPVPGQLAAALREARAVLRYTTTPEEAAVIESLPTAEEVRGILAPNPPRTEQPEPFAIQYPGQHDDCIATIPHYHDRPYQPGDWSAE